MVSSAYVAIDHHSRDVSKTSLSGNIVVYGTQTETCRLTNNGHIFSCKCSGCMI